MKLSLNILHRDIQSHLVQEYAPDFPLLIVADAEENKVLYTPTSIKVPNSLMNFIPKILMTFKALATSKKPLASINYAHHQSGEYITTLNMFRTKQTSFLFEPFTKMGINLHKLLLGINKTHSKIYLDTALIGHLSRLGQDIQNQMTLYLMSMMQLFTQLNEISLNTNMFNNSKLSSSELRIKHVIWETISDFVKTFDNDISVELLETDTSAISYLEVFQNTYASNIPIQISGQVSSTYVVLKDKKNKYSLLFKTASKDYFRINFQEGEVLTTLKMTYLDFDSDSHVIGFAGTLATSTYPVIVQYSSTLDLDTLEKVSILESPSEVEDSAILEKIEKFLANCSSVREIVEATNLEEFYKDLNKDYFDIESSTYISNEVIKAQYATDSYAQQLYQLNKKMIDRLGPVDLQELSNIVPSIIKGETYSAIFVGESGTGKSTTAKHIAYQAGIPFELINASINIEESDFIGTMVANKNRKSDLDPMFVWKDGILARAVRNGYVSIIEEINFGRAGVLGKLNSLLDDSRQLELGDGTILQAHPNFRLFATGNIGEEGTQRLNRALINRFQHAKKFKHLNKQEAIALIISKTKYKDQDKIDKVYAVYDAVRKYAKENQLKLSISIRQIINIFMAPKVYKTAYDAIINFMINQAFLEETEHQEHFVETVLSVFDLKFRL
jgi:ABC-type dipeptide/oligopeptide/nickel transport system ATPase component